jgi:hypothetical protein
MCETGTVLVYVPLSFSISEPCQSILYRQSLSEKVLLGFEMSNLKKGAGGLQRKNRPAFGTSE